VRNRLVFTATGNNLGSNEAIPSEKIAPYAVRAHGGLGRIVTEGLRVHSTSIINGSVPLLYEPAPVPQPRRLDIVIGDASSPRPSADLAAEAHDRARSLRIP